MASIHWFPGHMKQALNNIQERIKSVDLIIEILDSRIPQSSLNEDFEKMVSNKKKLFIFTKADLADINETNKWLNHFKNRNEDYIFLDVIHGDVKKEIDAKIKEIGKEKHLREISKGMKPQPIRALIIGIPNVGKSSLINKLASRKAAGVQNKPGFTRGEQFIKVSNDFLLVDTPGILPMNYENKNKAINLALIGSIKETILPNDELVEYLLVFLRKNYPNALEKRFNISQITEQESVLIQIANKRGYILSGGVYDLEKARIILLKEFKEGLLGNFTLEKAPC